MLTEDQIVAELPTKIKLGDKEYDIKQMKLGKAMAWRAEFGPLLSKVMASYGEKADTPEVFMSAFVDSPKLMTDAVFAYMPDLPKEIILDTATEQQMMMAFVTVMGFAFGPFLGEVVFLTGFKRQMEKATSQALEPSSRLQ